MTRDRPVIAIYPGSFDPLTKGHEDVVRRSLCVADQVIIAIASSATQVKESFFSVDERLEVIKEVFLSEERVKCLIFQGLLVDFARETGAQFVIRGLRAVSDFEYEFQMAQMNRELWDGFETIFLTPDQSYSFLSASLVREIAILGGDVSNFVSDPVLKKIKEALG
tara:strand:+ start:3790 stop:4287 length:498 start_codon:yes stop_codon:yes gene_type:complete